jgi:hypothetical protein
MPRATANVDTTEKVELKTCPGGYIELRRMTYGQKLQRQSMAMVMKLSDDPKTRNRGMQGEMQMVNAKVTVFEFAHCIVDHNLEDDAGRKLNLTTLQDINALDPRIGEEINSEISRMNNFDESEEDVGNFEGGSEQQ